MLIIWLYTLISVIVVSLISLVGVFTLSVSREKLEKVLIYLVSLSAGTLLGDAFIHLLPESFSGGKESIIASYYVLAGILVFFVLEKFFHWRHCHEGVCDEHNPKPFSYNILVGDSVHNFIDGLVIAASFLVSIPVGTATALAVIFHEIPQEIGDFGSLVYGGFSRKKALAFNFLTALFSILGAIIVLALNLNGAGLSKFLVPFAAGGFIYIASTDLIPELHKHTDPKKSAGQFLSILLGIGIMLALILFE
jgi:zinc and cadmium transporter